MAVHLALIAEADARCDLGGSDPLLEQDAGARDPRVREERVGWETELLRERAASLRRLHEMVLAETTDRFALDVAIAEALAAFTSFLETTPASSKSLRPSVRRARDFLLAHMAEDVTLDDVADHARADKFHLCREFSRELGLPPYAFLTRARIARACILLRGGVRPSDVAARVGFCDQSQMHRHFVRVVGCTPGRYAGSRNASRARARSQPRGRSTSRAAAR